MKEVSNAVFTLKALNIHTEGIFSKRWNERYYSGPPSIAAATTSKSSVETNVGDVDRERNDDKQGSGHRLCFTFDTKPKNIKDGWVFGSDRKTCDVLIGEPIDGVSRSHFRITFDQQRRLVVIDSSTHGTAVSYDGQARNNKRKNPSDRKLRTPRHKSNDFTWILFPEIMEKRIIIGHKIMNLPNAPIIEFSVDDVVNPDSDLTSAYLAEMGVAIPFVLNIDTHDTTRAQTQLDSPIQRPKQEPIWINREVIGKGQYGTVHQAVDVSTGAVYAAKELQPTDKASLESFKRESELLSKISHDHIVKFVSYETSGEHPRLIMEYLPSNLRQCDLTSAIIPWETVTLLCQGLDALDFLHSRKIIHRDLKPENILVQCREPNFRIKLADFGLAGEGSYANTQCGTKPYLAPEVLQYGPYTNKVDIWSLGLVAFECAYGLPYYDKHVPQSHWYDLITERIDDLEPDSLLNFLKSSMLTKNPQMRLSARECLTKAAKLLETTLSTQNLEPDSGTPTEVMSSDSAMRTDQAVGNRGQQMAAESAEVLSDVSTITQIRDPPPDTNYVPEEVEQIQEQGSASRRRRARQELSPNEEPPCKRLKDQEPSEELSSGREPYFKKPTYLEVKAEKTMVSIRGADFWINATHILKASGCDYRKEIIKFRKERANYETVQTTPAHRGTYVDPVSGLELCEEYRLEKLASNLRKTMEEYGWEPVAVDTFNSKSTGSSSIE